METKHRWQPRAAGAVKWIAVTLSALVMTVLLSLPASGSAVGDHEWVAHRYSSCSDRSAKLWTSDPYGGYQLVGVHYKAYNVNSKLARIMFSHAAANTFHSCGPAGTALRPYKVVLTTTFRLRGSNLSCSISAGVPRNAGFSCSLAGADLVFTHVNTCYLSTAANISCDFYGGTMDIPASTGQSFADYRTMQASSELFAHSGSSLLTTTPLA